jgi:hypothetical protein
VPMNYIRLECSVVRMSASNCCRNAEQISMKFDIVEFYSNLLTHSNFGSTQPPIQWVPGALSPGVKRPGRGADHSPPASAEVKKMWIYTSTPPYAFMFQTKVAEGNETKIASPRSAYITQLVQSCL